MGTSASSRAQQLPQQQPEARKRVLRPRTTTGRIRVLVALVWLGLTLGLGLTVILGGGVVATAAPAQTVGRLDCGPSNGTPQPTPPLEQPSTTTGGNGGNGLPCSSGTATGNGAGGSLTPGALPTPAQGTPNVPVPLATAVPAPAGSANGSHGSGASCSGPFCFLQNAWNGVTSWVSHTWNSMPSWAKGLVVGIVVAVVVVVVLVVVAPLLPFIGAGAIILAGLGAIAGGVIYGLMHPNDFNIWGAIFSSFGGAIIGGLMGVVGVYWSSRAILAGLINGAITFGIDLLTGSSPQEALSDAFGTAVMTTAAFLVGVGAYKLADNLGWVTKLTKVKWLVRIVGHDGEQGWLGKLMGVKGLAGWGGDKFAITISTRVASSLFLAGAYGLEVANQHFFQGALPLPKANGLATTSQIITNLVFLPVGGEHLGNALWSTVITDTAKGSAQQGGAYTFIYGGGKLITNLWHHLFPPHTIAPHVAPHGAPVPPPHPPATPTPGATPTPTPTPTPPATPTPVP